MLSKRVRKGDASLCPKTLAVCGMECEGAQAVIFLTTAEVPSEQQLTCRAVAYQREAEKETTKGTFSDQSKPQ